MVNAGTTGGAGIRGLMAQGELHLHHGAVALLTAMVTDGMRPLLMSSPSTS